MSENGFRFGDWQIDPDSNTLRSEGATSTVEPKAMEVLRYLCRHAGAVIPPEELLQACWGNAELGDNPIHKAITQLRRALGDSASEPRYIETVRKRGYRAIAPVLSEEAALEGSWQQGSPFRGLESFQESHAAIFFGRMQATAQLRELVLNQASGGCAMALVLGPSGSGKTSLVRAGLLPGLMASRSGSGEPVALACTLYMDCADLADGNLFQALAAVLIDAEVGGQLVFAGENAEGLGRWLETSDAAAIAGRFMEIAGRIKIGLFVDRLEAIFRAPGVTDEMRSRFIAVLEHLARSKAVLVMLACRNDFYPEVIALPALMALKSRGGHFDLNPPDGAEIAQMVRMPAKVAGLKFEVDPVTGASLDDVLCDAARGSPDTLPLLQYCLNELYRQRSDTGLLRFDVFKQLGGIEGAIAVRAEQVVTCLSAAQLGALPLLLSLIVDVNYGQGTATSRRAQWSALVHEPARELAQALVEARLLVSELTGGKSGFGVAHEALLRQWPRVSNWIELHRQALQLRTRISQDAQRWLDFARDRDLLLPKGSQLNAANQLLAEQGFLLSELEKEYIHVSLKRARVAEQVKLGAMILISALAILAMILGIVARRAEAKSDNHRADAEGLMSYMLGDFVEKLRPLGKLDLLGDISKKAVLYYSSDRLGKADAPQLAQYAKALQIIAEVNISQSHPDEALQALITARTILLKLAQHEVDQKQILKELGSNSFWLGRVYSDRNQWQPAEQAYSDYVVSSEKLVTLEPNNIEYLMELGYANNSIGDLALKRLELDKARASFAKSLALARQAAALKPEDTKLIGNLANSLSLLATTLIRLGDLTQAQALFDQEETLLRPLHHKSPEDATWNRRLGAALWRQGELLIAQDHIDAGIAKLELAENFFKNLITRDPTNRVLQTRLYSLQLKIMDAKGVSAPASHVTIALGQIHDRLIELHEAEPTKVEVKQLLAKSEQLLGKSFLKYDKLVEASAAFKASQERLSQLLKKDPDNHSLMIDTSLGLLNQAEYHRRSGERLAEKISCEKVQLLLTQFSGRSNDYRILSPLVRSHICTGDRSKVKSEIEFLNKINYKSYDYPST